MHTVILGMCRHVWEWYFVTIERYGAAVFNNLGVQLDSQLTMADHIAAVCHSGFFQLWQLRCIRQSLTPAATKTLVHRLDYCNQLFVGVIGWLLDKLQSLQNAAAHLVMEARKFDHITPVIRQLHWLPVRQRLRFKMTFLVFKCLCGLAPVYLVNYCKTTSANTGCFHLWSANLCQLSVPRTSTSYGDRSFTICGPSPSMWNSLPAVLRSTNVSVETFRTQLKTFLFRH